MRLPCDADGDGDGLQDKEETMLIPHDTTILVVDGGHMQVLRNRGVDAMPELELLYEQAMKNPPSRAMGTDAPGRSFGSAAPTRSAYADADYHQRKEDRFGKEALQAVASLGRQDRPLIVIAPPHMLGVLRGVPQPDNARSYSGGNSQGLRPTRRRRHPGITAIASDLKIQRPVTSPCAAATAFQG